MALSQADRIVLSKKIVAIPQEDATAVDNKAKLAVAKAKAQAEDDANKNLFDAKNSIINAYQAEANRMDGNDRLSIVEQDLINTAKAVLGNFFSPNNAQVPTPALSDGVWKNFIPYSKNKALGKTYAEVYGTVANESDSVSAINSLVTTMESYTAIKRSTGQMCTVTGTCSLPAFTTQLTCTGGGGTWTPGPDLITNDPAVQATATSLISAVNSWKSFIQTTLSLIVTYDTDAGRQAQNNAAIADINNAIVQINTWLAYPSFDTTHGQSTCAGLAGYNVNLLDPTKFRAGELAVLKNEITARTAYIATRINQLNTVLGTISQDVSSGNILSSSGFYGDRMGILNLRLNLMNGSLRKIESLKLAEKSQDEAINSNANAASVYSSVLKVVAFRAPATNITTIHVKDATGFSVSDNVYIASDNQAEISTTIVSISGNAVTLAIAIPEKYRQNENARMYKEL